MKTFRWLPLLAKLLPRTLPCDLYDWKGFEASGPVLPSTLYLVYNKPDPENPFFHPFLYITNPEEDGEGGEKIDAQFSAFVDKPAINMIYKLIEDDTESHLEKATLMLRLGGRDTRGHVEWRECIVKTLRHNWILSLPPEHRLTDSDELYQNDPEQYYRAAWVVHAEWVLAHENLLDKETISKDLLVRDNVERFELYTRKKTGSGVRRGSQYFRVNFGKIRVLNNPNKDLEVYADQQTHMKYLLRRRYWRWKSKRIPEQQLHPPEEIEPQNRLRAEYIAPRELLDLLQN